MYYFYSKRIALTVDQLRLGVQVMNGFAPHCKKNITNLPCEKAESKSKELHEILKNMSKGLQL